MHQFIKNVAIGDTYLAPSGVPFTQVQLRFYWEPAKSFATRTEEQITADNAEIGRQLMEAIWNREAEIKEETKNSRPTLTESKFIEDHSG